MARQGSREPLTHPARAPRKAYSGATRTLALVTTWSFVCPEIGKPTEVALFFSATQVRRGDKSRQGPRGRPEVRREEEIRQGGRRAAEAGPGGSERCSDPAEDRRSATEDGRSRGRHLDVRVRRKAVLEPGLRA